MPKSEANNSLGAPTFSIAPPNLADLRGIVKRGWLLPVLGAAAGAAAGLYVLIKSPPNYRAIVSVIFDNSNDAYMRINQVTAGPVLGEDRYSQPQVISSESIIEPVVKKLNLVSDPELGCPITEGNTEANSAQPAGALATLKQNVSHVRVLTGLRPPTTAPMACDTTTAFKGVTERLQVWWEAQPNIIGLSYSSKDPVKAATIANEIANSYIGSTLDSREKAAYFVAKSLEERLANLKAQAIDAETQVMAYKLENGMSAADVATAGLQNSSGLHEQITTARTAMLDAKARAEGARQAQKSLNATSFIPDNDMIQRLRERHLDVSTRVTELESRVGKDHSAVLKLQNQQTEIQKLISVERRRIVNSFAEQYDILKARFDGLVAIQSAQNTVPNADDKALVRLRELEAAALTMRNLYASTMESIGRSKGPDNKPLVVPFARVLKHATTPTSSGSTNKRLGLLAGSSALGLLLGAALAVLRKNPIGVFRTTEQIKTSLGLMAITVPRITASGHELMRYTKTKPYTRFSQSVRKLRLLISTANRDKGAKIIGVVSALGSEGKTTIAANIANQAAEEASIRTLLIDSDFHHQSLSRAMASGTRFGLKEAIEQPSRLMDYVIRNERNGLEILPCVPNQVVPNAAELLGSDKMGELLLKARDMYDLVIIESPPADALSDFGMLARHCDGFVFVAEWGKTSQRLVQDTLSEVQGFWERVICVVLNKADQAALRSIERFKGSDDERAYSDPSGRKLQSA